MKADTKSENFEKNGASVSLVDRGAPVGLNRGIGRKLAKR